MSCAHKWSQKWTSENDFDISPVTLLLCYAIDWSQKSYSLTTRCHNFPFLFFPFFFFYYFYKKNFHECFVVTTSFYFYFYCRDRHPLSSSVLHVNPILHVPQLIFSCRSWPPTRRRQRNVLILYNIIIIISAISSIFSVTCNVGSR